MRFSIFPLIYPIQRVLKQRLFTKIQFYRTNDRLDEEDLSPTIIVVDGFRYFFFSNEGEEKPHIHVQKGSDICKFWLSPKVRLAQNSGFKLHELRRIEAVVLENREIFLGRWHEFFKSRG